MYKRGDSIGRFLVVEVLGAGGIAIAICERFLGKTSHSVAAPLTGLGAALIALGKHQEAVPHLERALALEKTKGASRRIAQVQALLSRARRHR